MPFAPIAGGELYFETAGAGPPVLLVSGLSGLSRFWRPQVERLVPHFSVVVHDHRGTGRSSRDRIEYSIEQMSADTLALMDYLGIERAALVGQSTGGAIGQWLAAEHPRRISRLVLSSTWTHCDAYFGRLFESRRDVLRAAGMEVYTRVSNLFLYPPQWIRDHDREIAAAEAQSAAGGFSIDIVASRIEALLRFDGRAFAPRVGCPTLVIAALDDQITPAYFSRALAESVPGARLALLEHGGHALPVVEAERYGEIVRGFLLET